MQADGQVAGSDRTAGRPDVTNAGPLQYLDRVVATIVEVAQPQAIVLFGSAAKGTAGPQSDLDLLIVKELEKPQDRWDTLYRIECALFFARIGVPTDLVLKTPDEVRSQADSWIGVVYDAVREGRVVHGEVALRGRDA